MFGPIDIPFLILSGIKQIELLSLLSLTDFLLSTLNLSEEDAGVAFNLRLENEWKFDLCPYELSVLSFVLKPRPSLHDGRV
jgi:hypothetical protein